MPRVATKRGKYWGTGTTLDDKGNVIQKTLERVDRPKWWKRHRDERRRMRKG